MLLSVVAMAQDKRISIKAQAQPIKKVLQRIQEGSNYNIVYSDEVVADSIFVSIDANQKTVASILDEILRDKKLFYKQIAENLIVIGGKNGKSADLKAEVLISVSGRLVDQQNKPVPFASVGLLKAQTFVNGSTTNENGYFQLVYAFENSVAYELRASSLGYENLTANFTYPDTASLKRLVMKQEAKTLATINVTANRPMIERKADRFLVNVEGSALAMGYNALEVLQKSPGLWVSANGDITLRGNQSVMVMINDVVQRMSGSDLSDYLRSLRSEDISKIEIISNPPSEFEAAGSGGIVHIILKKARQDGLFGSVSSQYRQQVEHGAYNAATLLNYKTGNLYLFGNVSGGQDKNSSIASTGITYPDQSRYLSFTDRLNNNSKLTYRFGATYDLSKNEFLSVQMAHFNGKLNQYFDTHIDVSNSSEPLTGFARSEWYRKPKQDNVTANYSLKLDTLGSSLKIIGDYVYSAKTELNDFASVYTLTTKNSTFRNNTPNATNIYSLQSDFTKVFPHDWEMKAGLKFVATKRDNEVLNEDYIGENWVVNNGLSNRFIYKEYLSMGYASLAKKIGKTSVKLGLRAEHTQMNGNSITANEQFKRNYLSLFPSLFIMRQLNAEKGSSVFLNYSRRLQRPSFADLNPYRLQFDNYLTQLGNPNLMPEYTHKVELGTNFGKGFFADVYYALTTDKIAMLANPASAQTIEYQTRNFNNSYEYGLAINLPIKLFSFWSTYTGLSVYNLSYQLDDFKIKQTTFMGRSQHTFMLKNIVDIDVSVDYRSPNVSANTHNAYWLITDFGLTKRFLKKSLQTRFYISDLFNTAREKDFTEYSGTRIDFYQKRATRTFSLSLSYSFSSGKKFSNKKIEESSEDEKRRIGN